MTVTPVTPDAVKAAASKRTAPDVPAGPHQPALPAFGARRTKWGCTACPYWTGYQSDKKARQMIQQHCATKNPSITARAATIATKEK